jgi:hypothetical protein
MSTQNETNERRLHEIHQECKSLEKYFKMGQLHLDSDVLSRLSNERIIRHMREHLRSRSAGRNVANEADFISLQKRIDRSTVLVAISWLRDRFTQILFVHRPDREEALSAHRLSQPVVDSILRMG